MKVGRLVEKAKKGDWQAFLQLALVKKDQLYYKALTLMRNEDDAADAVEETLLKAYSSMVSLQEPRYFQTWLTKILIHTCIDMQKLNRKTIFVEQAWLEREVHSPHEEIAGKLDLQDQLAGLGEEYRTVLVLRYYGDCKVDEIAGLLNIPAGTVKSRIFYGLKKLQQNMGGGRQN